jgi:Fic family protein
LTEEMAEFLDWFEDPGEMNPLLAAGLAHFWFVTIHPFDDGNGRIARAIADMALDERAATAACERYRGAAPTR